MHYRFMYRRVELLALSAYLGHSEIFNRLAQQLHRHFNALGVILAVFIGSICTLDIIKHRQQLFEHERLCVFGGGKAFLFGAPFIVIKFRSRSQQQILLLCKLSLQSLKLGVFLFILLFMLFRGLCRLFGLFVSLHLIVNFGIFGTLFFSFLLCQTDHSFLYILTRQGRLSPVS